MIYGNGERHLGMTPKRNEFGFAFSFYGYHVSFSLFVFFSLEFLLFLFFFHICFLLSFGDSTGL
jgi:hypothetical protein